MMTRSQGIGGGVGGSFMSSFMSLVMIGFSDFHMLDSRFPAIALLFNVDDGENIA